ncbi:peroxiredoxin [Haematobacter massiliensis]|uniref:thioredoxin-dependent peroxiredoxin n=1 Tax=Haematobacter massiliensis TaxID=195105 RepID=A0A086YD50_9RHOB|nr:thioredoxin-dependent thiol peroxidase [Haematobacter massiliensis]KFI32200.1 alkyl hydroperoxide reductase [Haematobacter massiliensis]OWJ72791.1 peroxiredoxin [Haematobacter massiliensis]OWJ85834.1 peroxiredoxin [Haematobacter massiliensis]QBJ24578.1 thioredoxin-dependent thiol peroxidase [Haematobacter massiliensis]
MIEVGQPAPDFTLPLSNGESITLSSLRPRKVVVYFYPKADTPGCTTEALDFSALLADFDAADTTVIAISKDPVTAHEKFARKHGLSVLLASDAEGDTAERYGVWGEKKMYGRTFMGLTRATFLIDSEGRIAMVWPKVKVADHAAEVLKAAQELH